MVSYGDMKPILSAHEQLQSVCSYCRNLKFSENLGIKRQCILSQVMDRIVSHVLEYGLFNTIIYIFS